MIGAVTAALAMIVAGCLNIRQAMRAFDHRIYLMIGASLAAAAALEATGGAAAIADAAVGAVAGTAPWITLSAIFLVTSLMTNILSQQRHRRPLHARSPSASPTSSMRRPCRSWWR